VFVLILSPVKLEPPRYANAVVLERLDVLLVASCGDSFNEFAEEV
jgi:hypothetical protein